MDTEFIIIDSEGNTIRDYVKVHFFPTVGRAQRYIEKHQLVDCLICAVVLRASY
jgi:hypothetical protein